MVRIKHFLTSECVLGLLEKISNIEWSTTDSYIPLRSVQSLNFCPVLREELTNQIGQDLFKKDKIHFVKYPTSTKADRHRDPCNYTLVVLLQEAPGGNLILNKDDLIELSPGDAVLFKGSTLHRVSTVTSGERIALAVWLNKVPQYSNHFE